MKTLDEQYKGCVQTGWRMGWLTHKTPEETRAAVAVMRAPVGRKCDPEQVTRRRAEIEARSLKNRRYVCVECGAEFRPKTSQQRCCTMQCSAERERKQKTVAQMAAYKSPHLHK